MAYQRVSRPGSCGCYWKLEEAILLVTCELALTSRGFGLRVPEEGIEHDVINV